MGFVDLWRQKDKKTDVDLKLEYGQERDDKLLCVTTEAYFDAFWRKPNHALKRQLMEKSRKYCLGDMYVEDKRYVDEKGKKEEEAEIEVAANFYGLMAAKYQQLLVASESDVIAKPLPDELTGSEETMENINEMFDAARHNLVWKKYSFRARYMMVKYGTGYVHTGFDPRAGVQTERILKDESDAVIYDEEDNPQMEAIANGEAYFETLHPLQVALDEECIEFAKTRTAVVKREWTREQLYQTFKDDVEELKGKLFGEDGGDGKGKSWFTKMFKKGKDTRGSGTETATLYEVFIKPNKFSDHFKNGLHAYLVKDLVLRKDEDPQWRKKRGGGYRLPVSSYIMEEDEDSPLGITRLWQLSTLHVYRNQFIDLMLLDGQQGVLNQLLINPALIDADDLTNRPGAVLQLKEGVNNPNVSLSNAAYRIGGSSTSPGLVQALGVATQSFESVAQYYDPKHGFKSGQRRVGEMEILAEEHRNANAPSAENAWAADAEVWGALYDVMDRNVNDPYNWLYKSGEDYKSVNVNRLLFEKPKEDKEAEPDRLGVDFVVVSKHLPEPSGIKLQKTILLYDKGVFGMPGTPSAIGKLNRILAHIDELPEDPRGERYDSAAKEITDWLEALRDDQQLLETPPRISPFWDHARVWEKLEDWFAVHLRDLTQEQTDAYEAIMGLLEDAGKMRQLDEMLKDVQAQKILGMAAQANPNSAVDQGTMPDADPGVMPGEAAQ